MLNPKQTILNIPQHQLMRIYRSKTKLKIKFQEKNNLTEFTRSLLDRTITNLTIYVTKLIKLTQILNNRPTLILTSSISKFCLTFPFILSDIKRQEDEH